MRYTYEKGVYSHMCNCYGGRGNNNGCGCKGLLGCLLGCLRPRCCFGGGNRGSYDAYYAAQYGLKNGSAYGLSTSNQSIGSNSGSYWRNGCSCS